MGYVSSAIVAAVLGTLSARVVFVGSWINLIPWAIAGILVGVFSKTRKSARWDGAVYGFVLPVVFMIAGREGAWTTNTVWSFGLLCLILGIIGIGCGMVLALIGRKFTKSQPEHQ